jgi:hypothetical protein
MPPLKIVTRSDGIASIPIVVPGNEVIEPMMIQGDFQNAFHINIKEERI